MTQRVVSITLAIDIVSNTYYNYGHNHYDKKNTLCLALNIKKSNHKLYP